MDAQLLKLADLQIDHNYYVIGYSAINTKFGDTYILQCVEHSYDNPNLTEFEMYATKLISSYISQYSPKDNFLFKVRKNSKYTYAEISGYKPSSGFIRLNKISVNN